MGPVGEITETVGGLNRNAGTLSPKYAALGITLPQGKQLLGLIQQEVVATLSSDVRKWSIRIPGAARMYWRMKITI